MVQIGIDDVKEMALRLFVLERDNGRLQEQNDELRQMLAQAIEGGDGAGPKTSSDVHPGEGIHHSDGTALSGRG